MIAFKFHSELETPRHVHRSEVADAMVALTFEPPFCLKKRVLLAPGSSRSLGERYENLYRMLLSVHRHPPLLHNQKR
jgi:hypothetical protein